MLYLATGCHPANEKSTFINGMYKFDSAVITKLPIYDSLASAILKNLPFFIQHINDSDSYRAYKYMPQSDQQDVHKKLPKEISSRIDHYFSKLDSDFIKGFDVFKDSTIKIYIRNSPTVNDREDVEENLSYYPTGNKIKHRQSPVTDTILTEHWQYWYRFNKRDLFK